MKTLRGDAYKIEMENVQETVLKLKEKVEEKLYVSPQEQRIIFAGKQLEDNRTLLDYNVKHESTVHLVIRFIGEEIGSSAQSIMYVLVCMYSYVCTHKWL